MADKRLCKIDFSLVSFAIRCGWGLGLGRWTGRHWTGLDWTGLESPGAWLRGGLPGVGLGLGLCRVEADP